MTAALRQADKITLWIELAVDVVSSILTVGGKMFVSLYQMLSTASFLAVGG